MKQISLVLSFILFVALFASGSFWVLHFSKPQARHIAAPAQASSISDASSVAGLFGGAAAVSTNYQLKGIILANPATQSGAIIAVDGQPAQAFRVNAEIAAGITLGEVHPEYILLVDRGVNRRIDLPKDGKALGLMESGSRSANATVSNRASESRVPDLAQINRDLRQRGLQPLPTQAPPPAPAPHASD